MQVTELVKVKVVAMGFFSNTQRNQRPRIVSRE